ncbi:FRG domain-containing protein [Vibrio chagasii]|uniref:FRG domain-containing protein n=1 Tax=Vibrio TaxID=662 RepID=UPI0014939DD6|nr:MULTISPECIES: FRG domain-containing protein [Vibrio]MCG9566867.1 FRG domain-containing protein [Vibrio chagasii]NOI39547.1 FRG domain-containing protein [Vibrio sp. 070316B]NOI84905.1 FRG domain-containing protein [Vibrio sp. 99K-1]CAH6799233.1 FRG domain-containing protein [Vibrio chagasii]CAH6802616.1 FRG domain-containing protein [Vibrio chagasii]
MNYIDTKLFRTVAQPSNLIELLSYVSKHAEDRRNVYLWRGQADICWPIHSSAFRRLSNRGEVTESSMQSYEKYLLEHATHQGYRFENGRELSDFELLAKLQHHGAATRLIDVSRNLLVGLWFCCSSEPQATGLLLGVHSDFLGGGENKVESREYTEIFEDLEEYENPQTWQPPTVTKRIAAQGGQFLYSSVSQNAMGSLTLDTDPEANLPIAITPEVKKVLLEELEGTFDIRYLTLFPDIDGFGHAHSFRYDRWDAERW